MKQRRDYAERVLRSRSPYGKFKTEPWPQNDPGIPWDPAKFKALVKAQGLTWQALADALLALPLTQCVMLSPQTIYTYSTKVKPTKETLAALCRVLECKPEDLSE